MKDVTENTYVYKTKCRVCGSIADWCFAKESQSTRPQFEAAMADYVLRPRQHKCEKCKTQTIQEVVSYGIVEF